MKKKETIAQQVPKIVKANGYRMDWFLKEVGISRSHFYFIRKGERPLTDENKKKINKVLKTDFK